MAHSAPSSTTRPDLGALAAELDARLGELEMTIYQTLDGLVLRCEALAAQAEAQALLPQLLRARLLASDVLSRQGLAGLAREQQIALFERAGPWPALQRHAATYLASSCDRLGLRLETMRWVAASVHLDGSPEASAEATHWHAEALMVAALFAASHSGADYSLVERAMDAVRAAGDPVLVSVTAANFAEVASEGGQLMHASHYADEAEAAMRRHPECAAALSWESVARARLACGERAAARLAMQESLRVEETLGCCDVNGDPWLSYAEVLLASDDAAAAMHMLEHPRRRQRQATSSWTALRERQLRARVLAAQGQWEQAYRGLEDYVAGYQQARSLEAERAAAQSSAAVAVDDARRQARHFEQLALTDALTGLPNRRHAERWLAECSAQAGGTLCVAIADLDHFKRINDQFSHDTGDRVLQHVGALLQAGVDGQRSLAARLGGEEFLLAFAGVDVAEAQAHCESLRLQLRAHRHVDVPGGLCVTVSIGLAHAHRPTATAALLRAADNALYEAKRRGRDQVVLAPPG